MANIEMYRRLYGEMWDAWELVLEQRRALVTIISIYAIAIFLCLMCIFLPTPDRVKNIGALCLAFVLEYLIVYNYFLEGDIKEMFRLMRQRQAEHKETERAFKKFQKSGDPIQM